ncbi:MAG: hypothetical protein PVI50_05370 [Gammaproteobacteria bacterium]|jgi:hypothetical protein
MQQLSDRERDFIATRQRLIRCCPPAATGLLPLLTGTGLILFLKHPALANACYVIDAVGAGTLPAEIMQVPAVFLPIVITLLFLHQTIRNERRYQAIIRRLREPASGAAGR